MDLTDWKEKTIFKTNCVNFYNYKQFVSKTNEST